MALGTQLEEKVKNATTLQAAWSSRPGTTGRAIFGRLHTLVTGGDMPDLHKQSLAYANALRTSNLIQTNAAIVMDFGGAQQPRDVKRSIDRAEKRVLIIDNLDKLPEDRFDAVAEALSGYVQGNKGVLFLNTSDPGLGEKLGKYPAFKSMIESGINLNGAPATSTPKSDAIIAQWREMKDLDVTIGKRVATGKVATFGGKPSMPK